MEYFDMEASPRAEQLQARLSEECKAFGVKERNAFVNYGWLLYVPGFREGMGKEYRLNFKDGLQKAAGQSAPPCRLCEREQDPASLRVGGRHPRRQVLQIHRFSSCSVLSSISPRR